MRYRLRLLERVSARTSRNTDHHPGQEWPALKVICLMHIASKETTHAQTVKLTPVTGNPKGPPTGATCKRPSVKTDQTARISLQIPVMSKSKRQNHQSAPKASAQPNNFTSIFLPRSLSERCPITLSGVPPRVSAPPVPCCLRIVPRARNPFFRVSSCFLHTP